jgi:hypothetical protein
MYEKLQAEESNPKRPRKLTWSNPTFAIERIRIPLATLCAIQCCRGSGSDVSNLLYNPGNLSDIKGECSSPIIREFRAELDKVLSSPLFVNSPRMSRFLRFVVETTLDGNGARIKEYVVATEVFDKGVDYDPQADSTVLVAMAMSPDGQTLAFCRGVTDPRLSRRQAEAVIPQVPFTVFPP